VERSNGGSSRIDGKEGWIVVAAITTILTFTSGARLLPGIVLKPVTTEFGWSRSELMLAISINMIGLSILQPFLGLVTDRIGARKVLVGGTALLGLMLLPLSRADALWQFYLLYGVVGAFALAAVSPVNVTSIVSGWFERRRGAALSISTSGSAFGQLMVVPAGTWLLTMTSWPNLYLILAVILLVVMTPLSLILVRSSGLPTRHISSTRHIPTDLGNQKPLKLGEAVAGSTFWLLAFGFFVCGFTMAFATAHFMAYADDMGMATTRAADIIAVTAIFSIAGSFLLGMAADRFDRRFVLSLTYGLRGIAFALLWVLPVGPLLFVYALVLGVSWTATTPLTAAIAADRYGREHIGLIFGMMFSFMNIGFGAGSFLDGLVYDTFGSYRAALLANAVLGLLAAVAVIQVGREHPVRNAELALPSADFTGAVMPAVLQRRSGD
jgi:MFS family permease